MHHHSCCECIVWRQGALRCELWSIGELGVLKIFDGSVLTHEETLGRRTWYRRAHELRQRAVDDMSVRASRIVVGQTAETARSDGNTGAAPVRPWVLTDLQGGVLDASTDAEDLFRITRRGLIGRNLYTFFDGERTTVMHCASVAASAQPVTLAGRVRPRDGKPLSVRVAIQRQPDTRSPSLQWTFK